MLGGLGQASQLRSRPKAPLLFPISALFPRLQELVSPWVVEGQKLDLPRRKQESQGKEYRNHPLLPKRLLSLIQLMKGVPGLSQRRLRQVKASCEVLGNQVQGPV